ncbi:hypothetical protein ACP4OV_027251 [Aristida adscensionis]
MDLNIPLVEEEDGSGGCGGFDLNVALVEEEDVNGGDSGDDNGGDGCEDGNGGDGDGGDGGEYGNGGDGNGGEYGNGGDGDGGFDLNISILEDGNVEQEDDDGGDDNGGDSGEDGNGGDGDAGEDGDASEYSNGGDGNAGFDLNISILEEGNGDVFDVNLPVDEFGAVNFDFIENITEHSMEAPVQVNQRRKDMSDELRKQVYQALLARSKNGKLGKKDTRIVADHFRVHIQAVQRLWKRGKTQLANFIPVVVDNRKKGRCGRKAIPVNLEVLRSIPLKERMTIEDVCSKLNMSKWKVQRLLKKGFLRRHSSSIKPYLTDANKKTRLKWCVDMIDKDFPDDPRFKDLFDIMFIDEKWFYLSQKSENYYLLPDEDDPHRTCKNKNYIPRLVLGQGLGMDSVFFMTWW